MITGNISNIDEKFLLDSKLRECLHFLKNTDFSKINDGKINFNNMIINIITHSTKNIEEINPESHKKFIDIHFIISGKESFGVGPTSNKNIVLEEYSEEKDSKLYKWIEGEFFVPVNNREYIIFFPEDIHRPGCNSDNKPFHVRKAIAKIPLI